MSSLRSGPFRYLTVHTYSLGDGEQDPTDLDRKTHLVHAGLLAIIARGKSFIVADQIALKLVGR